MGRYRDIGFLKRRNTAQVKRAAVKLFEVIPADREPERHRLIGVANVIYYCGQSVSNIFGLDYVGVVDREVQLFPGLQAAVAAEYKKAQLDHRGIVVASILSGR